LAARGRFWRVFGGQAIFLAAVLLALGAYILEQEFADPVQAQAAGLLFAAVLIAAAVTLMYCMLHPARKVRHRVIVRRIPASHWNELGSAATEQRTLAWREIAEDSSPRNRYVDRTRIRV
jgi:hypothetical protein